MAFNQFDNGLPIEAVAVSAFNAWSYAQGLKSPNFDHLSIEDMGKWGRLANHAEQLLNSMEGKPLDVATSEVYKFWSREGGDYAKLNDWQKLHWQAVVRHLATLIDAEEIPDLQTLERSWGQWVIVRGRKLKKHDSSTGQASASPAAGVPDAPS
jgi:hypothetical protein